LDRDPNTSVPPSKCRRVVAESEDAAGTRPGPHTVVFRKLESKPSAGRVCLRAVSTPSTSTTEPKKTPSCRFHLWRAPPGSRASMVP